MKLLSLKRAAGPAALLVASAALAGCGDREADSETPVAEAEVSTELPEEVVSDQQLQATADAAADMASQPPPPVAVAVPVPGDTTGGNMQQPATNQQTERPQ